MQENATHSEQNNIKPKTKLINFIVFLVGITLSCTLFIYCVLSPTSNSSDDNIVTRFTTGTSSPTTVSTSYQKPTTFPYDLNKISKEQLTEIDGIGDVIAGRIIAYRIENNGFTSISQLLEIDGIGEEKYNLLKKYLYVDSPSVTTTTTVVTTRPPVTTSPKVTTTAPITTTVPKTTCTSVTVSRVRHSVNINKADIDEIMNGFLITYEQAEAIVNLRNDIQYFSNPLEVLYAKYPNGENVFSYNEFNRFIEYIIV